MNNITSILGIDFQNLNANEVYNKLYQEGGLITVPSGPGLASIPENPVYYEALLHSDWSIADSGLMALIWNKIEKEKVKRVSGLALINAFTELYPTQQDKKLFLVNPTPKEQEANLSYFASIGVSINKDHNHLAPMYDKQNIQDEVLLAKLEALKPHFVMLNIGGGVQEILGYWLKQHLSYQPAIICTGAAIAFKTGQQVSIPVLIDKLYLGWFWRICSNPKVYGARFYEARKLVPLLLKYRSQQIK